MTAAPQYGTGEDGPVYLSTKELAERYRTAPSSIRDWRSKGYGPLGVKFGRNVLYPLPEVEAFERRLTEEAKRQQRRNASGITTQSSAQPASPRPAGRALPRRSA